MIKQTSLTLLRLGINRGWIFRVFSKPFLYTVILNYCLFIYLFLKMSFFKNKLWLMSYFIFFTFKKCVIHVFYWRAILLKKKFITLFSIKKFKFKKSLKWKKKKYFYFINKQNFLLNKLVFISLKKKNILKKKFSFIFFLFTQLKKKYVSIVKLLTLKNKKFNIYNFKLAYLNSITFKKINKLFTFKRIKNIFIKKFKRKTFIYYKNLGNSLKFLRNIKNRNKVINLFSYFFKKKIKNYFYFSKLGYFFVFNFVSFFKNIYLLKFFNLIKIFKNKSIFFLMLSKFKNYLKVLNNKFTLKKIFRLIKVIFKIFFIKKYFNNIKKLNFLTIKKKYFKNNCWTFLKIFMFFFQRLDYIPTDRSNKNSKIMKKRKSILKKIYKISEKTEFVKNKIFFKNKILKNLKMVKNKKITFKKKLRLQKKKINFFLSSTLIFKFISNNLQFFYLNIFFYRIFVTKFLFFKKLLTNKISLVVLKNFFVYKNKFIAKFFYYFKNFKFFFQKKKLFKNLFFFYLLKSFKNIVRQKINLKFFLKNIFIKNYKLTSKFFYRFSKNKKYKKKKFIFKDYFLKKNNNLSFLKKKIFVLQLEKKLDFFLSNLSKTTINVYNVLNYVKKSRSRFVFENNLIRRVTLFLSKKILNIFNNGFFSIRLFTKLLGWTFKLTGLCNLLVYYISLKIKTIKSHWALLRTLELIIFAYRLKYKNVVKGVKLVLKGKINSSLRTRKYGLLIGSVNQQSFNSTIDYAQSESFNLAGVFTIRFWIQL
jgi:hypothetical protein